MTKIISVVIPVYNDENYVYSITEDIKSLFAGLNYNYEIIFVDNGSTDQTLQKIRECADLAENIFYLDLSKKVGYQLAVKAGLDHAFGDCAITVKAEMHHPQLMIPELLDKWAEGFDVIYIIRENDQNTGKGSDESLGLFQKILNWLSDVDSRTGAHGLYLLDQKVVGVLRNFQENEPYLPGLITWLGFRQTTVCNNAMSSSSMTEKYTFKHFGHALDSISSFTVKPLYMAAYIGSFLSCTAILYIPYVIYAFVNHIEIPGWASVIMTIAFFGGLQLIILSIIGFYVGKIFMQTKKRPNYVIRSTNTLKR